MLDHLDRGRCDPGESSNNQQPPAEERCRKIFEYNNDAVMLVNLEDEEFLLEEWVRERG